jgi:peptide methionine sulfoxide reductase MsrA
MEHSKSIKQKLIDNYSITQADKSKTIMIIYKYEYDQYKDTLINNNNFEQLHKDPTSLYQRSIKESVNSCKLLIRSKEKQKYYNNNPNSPTLHALTKLHKTPITIRPVINWKNAPAYKIASFLTKIIREYITLPNTFNIQNTMNLIAELNNININHNTRIRSFDITNMYTNIPLNTLVNIIQCTLSKEDVPQAIIYEIDRITKLILEQNYFQHNNIFYKQKDGLTMGAPSSSILSEIFLQFMEHNEILKILTDHKIISYSRYVDDILIIYDHTSTNLNQVMNDSIILIT